GFGTSPYGVILASGVHQQGWSCAERIRSRRHRAPRSRGEDVKKLQKSKGSAVDQRPKRIQESRAPRKGTEVCAGVGAAIVSERTDRRRRSGPFCSAIMPGCNSGITFPRDNKRRRFTRSVKLKNRKSLARTDDDRPWQRWETVVGSLSRQAKLEKLN